VPWHQWWEALLGGRGEHEDAPGKLPALHRMAGGTRIPPPTAFLAADSSPFLPKAHKMLKDHTKQSSFSLCLWQLHPTLRSTRRNFILRLWSLFPPYRFLGKPGCVVHFPTLGIVHPHIPLMLEDPLATSEG